MKRLISPPIQLIFWLMGLLLLGWAVWNLYSLKMRVEGKHDRAEEVSVQIPDGGMLANSNPQRYPKMVQTPLFWESRLAVEPPPKNPTPVAAPVDTALPEGRLIGIVDTGDTLFAIMQNAAGLGVHLKKGESWGAWKVAAINSDKLVLSLGEQRKELPLVSDFAAPKANPQATAAAKNTKTPTKPPVQAKAPNPAANNLPPTGQIPQQPGAAMAESGGAPGQAPAPLSAEDALAARQRLMASRWGALTGEQQTPDANQNNQ